MDATLGDHYEAALPSEFSARGVVEDARILTWLDFALENDAKLLYQLKFEGCRCLAHFRVD